MTVQQLITKANLFFGVDVSLPTKFSSDSFEPRCLTTYHAITSMRVSYPELMEALDADRTELRLMWLYAEGNLGVVQKRRQYQSFKNTL